MAVKFSFRKHTRFRPGVNWAVAAFVVTVFNGCGKSTPSTSEDFQEDPSTEAIARMIIGAVNTTGQVAPDNSTSCKVASSSFQSDHFQCQAGCDGNYYRSNCSTQGVHHYQCGSQRYEWTSGSFSGNSDFSEMSWVNQTKPVGSQKSVFKLTGMFSNALISGELNCEIHSTLNFSVDRDMPAIDLDCQSTRCILDKIPVNCHALREYLVVNLCEQL